MTAHCPLCPFRGCHDCQYQGGKELCTPVDNTPMSSDFAHTFGTIGAQHKSGPDGAGNTVCSGPNPWIGGAMGQPTHTTPLTDNERLQLLTSTLRNDRSATYQLAVARAALDAPNWGSFLAATAPAMREEGARVLGRTATACHTITLQPWHRCDICGMTGEDN